MKNYYLAGDIGGTKTTLAILDADLGPRAYVETATFPSGSFVSLEDVLQSFLKPKNWQISRASFGIAGPVSRGEVTTTNLPWRVSQSALSVVLNAPVRIINDLSAMAYAIPFLVDDDLVTLNYGQKIQDAPIALIAPGTGLGEAFLFWNGTKYCPFSSEGGHADFAPADPLQLQLLAYLQKRYEHISYERVCSGKGLPNVYAFLKDERLYVEPLWLREEIEQIEDPSPIISRAGLQKSAEIAVAAMNLFSSILAAEAGNMALRVLAKGGVYLGGGIPKRILPFLKEAAFLKSFVNKGRFADFLETVPIHVIQNSDVALMGAACHVLEEQG